MYLNKYFCTSLLLACVCISINLALGSPLENEREQHRLRFLVLQKSDIISDHANPRQETNLESQNSPEEGDEEVEKTTTVASVDESPITAKDEILFEEVVVEDKEAPVVAEVIVEDDEKDFNFPKEPEPDVNFNQSEPYEHKPVDISQFPDLKIEKGFISGKAACQCGVTPQRIVNGVAVPIVEIPWTVGLGRVGWFGFGSSKKPFCGGTLINSQYVVTASHCVDGQFARNLNVWLNTEDLTNTTGRKVVAVEQIIMHPGYSRRTVDNDIAVIKLATPVTFGSSETLVPACIPANNDNDFSTYKATVAGWGTTSSGGPQSTYLRKVEVPVMTNEVCNRDTMYVNKISENMLCAGYKEGGKDACQGDSGGPLIIRNGERDTLVGVVSWGYGCAGANAPGVYTRVGRYPQWILENTSGGDWCES